jgi:hypothetical protein
VDFELDPQLKDFQQFFSSSYFISDEDWPSDFQISLATTQEPYSSIRVEMQTVSEMSMRKLIGQPVSKKAGDSRDGLSSGFFRGHRSDVFAKS